MLKLKLPYPPSRDEYYERGTWNVSQAGLAYQDLVRMEHLNNYFGLYASGLIKLDLTVYPPDENDDIDLSKVFQVLVDVFSAVELWKNQYPLEHKIKLGISERNCVDVKISKSKIIPAWIIDGCNPSTGK